MVPQQNILEKSGKQQDLTPSCFGVPPEYFLALPFSDEKIQGEVTYHKAFEICG